MALFHAELNRKAPGLLFRDILRGEGDARLAAQRIASSKADVVVLLGFDYDYHLVALQAFSDLIAEAGGWRYPDLFTLRPNTGLPTYLDMDGDGKTGKAGDAQGYGRFSGEEGMAILSRYPIDREAVQDFSDRLWASFEWADLPEVNGQLFPSGAAYEVQRLSTTAHWVVPVILPNGQTLSVGAYHATPPVFDGPEDRNGLRNADETRFWGKYLDQNPKVPLVIAGDANLDPLRGNGRREAIRELLDHELVNDPFPADTVTVDWSDIDLGHMRVDYILPTNHWTVLDTGTVLPSTANRDESRHALIWVDLAIKTTDSAPVLETSAPSQ